MFDLIIYLIGNWKFDEVIIQKRQGCNVALLTLILTRYVLHICGSKSTHIQWIFNLKRFTNMVLIFNGWRRD